MLWLIGRHTRLFPGFGRTSLIRIVLSRDCNFIPYAVYCSVTVAMNDIGGSICRTSSRLTVSYLYGHHTLHIFCYDLAILRLQAHPSKTVPMVISSFRTACCWVSDPGTTPLLKRRPCLPMTCYSLICRLSAMYWAFSQMTHYWVYSAEPLAVHIKPRCSPGTSF